MCLETKCTLNHLDEIEFEIELSFENLKVFDKKLLE